MVKLIGIKSWMNLLMFKRVSVECLEKQIDTFRSLTSPVNTITNYFNTPLNCTDVLLFVGCNALFFIARNQSSGLNYYFFLAKSGFLSSSDIEFPKDERLVAEYIFCSKLNIEVREHFKKGEFQYYANLKKMCLTRKDKYAIISPLSVIEICDISDLSYLKSKFDRCFDPISERCPSESELITAINKNSIFKYVKQDEILGFYWADSKKFISELRYIFVDENSRGVKVGQSLLEHHIYATIDVKKNQLWVLNNNNVAIRLYEKYGYTFEEMQDLISVRDIK
jgi:hypothetical protein